MESRLLASLNAQAEGTRDPVVWAKAVCRAASHFARHGHTEEALTSIGVVRAQFGKELHFEIASWLMLAEGVLHYFQGKPREAYDRVRRAHGLAIALENASARPTCAAWMAMLEVESCSFEKAANHLSEALTHAANDDYQAKCRAALVLANALHLAGSYALARPWYEVARQNATAEGDSGAISAMLYDVAAIRAANVRLEAVFGDASLAEAHRARMESASSTNYDAAIGVTSLDHLTKLLHGLLLTLEGHYTEALNTFENIAISDVLPRMRPPMLVDQAWCLVNIGKPIEAWQLATDCASLLESINDLDDDDLAYFAGRMSQIANWCGHPDEADAYKTKSLVALARHQAFQANLLKLMQPVTDLAFGMLPKKNPA